MVIILSRHRYDMFLNNGIGVDGNFFFFMTIFKKNTLPSPIFTQMTSMSSTEVDGKQFSAITLSKNAFQKKPPYSDSDYSQK